MNLKTHIGLKVKAARHDKGLTQEQLAEAIGKAVETVSNIERGFALTGIDTLHKIAQATGVQLTFFFGDIADDRNVSLRRLEAEQKLRGCAKALGDDDLSLALALMETMVRERVG